jgi:hypothetical protein
MFISSIVYFVFCGLVQLGTSIMYMIALNCYEKRSKFFLSFMISLLIFELMINFGIGIWSSLLWNYYSTSYIQLLNV